MNPALEWLQARLDKSPGTPQEIRDEAAGVGITPGELADAVKRLRVRMVMQTPEAGGRPYQTWVIDPPPASGFRPGFDARRYTQPRAAAKPEPVRADLVPDAPKLGKRTPLASSNKARDMARKASPRALRVVKELTERVDQDPEGYCPTCGRGTRRAEDIRLRAAVALLDRAGVGAARGAEDLGDSGPAIVFPPGTKIAVLAQVPEAPVEQREARLVRADEL